MSLLAVLIGGCSASARSEVPTPPSDQPEAPAGATTNIVVQKDRSASVDLAAVLGKHVRSSRVITAGTLGTLATSGDKATYTASAGADGVDRSRVEVELDSGEKTAIDVFADVRPCLRVPAGLSPVEELHVIGVYESGDSGLKATEANRKGTIEITIAKTNAPVKLVLGAYEGVHWRFVLEPGAQVASVTIDSYYEKDQSTEGLPAGTPITIGPAAASAHGWEPQYNSGGGSFREMIGAVRTKFGGTESSFQGAYNPKSFRVPFDGASLSRGSQGPEQRISHYSFADQKCDDVCARTATTVPQFWSPPAAPFDHFDVEGEGGRMARAKPDATWASARSSRGARCGKHYFELDVAKQDGAEGRDTSLGVLVPTGSSGDLLIAPATNGQVLTNVGTETVGVLLDLDAGRVFYRNAQGWTEPGFPGAPAEYSRRVVDPATGAAGAALDLWTYDDVVVGVDMSAGAAAHYRGAAPFTFPLPSGYTAGLD